MKYENELALVIAYYLSKFDTMALANLGYSSFAQAFEEIGATLGVKPNSVKNMRDEFDPLHENERAGWYQRPLRPSRAHVVEAFSDMPELTLRGIVHDIIHSEAFRNSGTLNRVLQALSEKANEGTGSQREYAPRGVTGKMAEELFWKWFHEGLTPWTGHLQDHRELGQGYDYLLQVGTDDDYCVEVKGLASETGGILLTDKEWRTAQSRGDRYIIVVISGLETSPKLSIVGNPASVLSPSRQISVAVVVSWSVPSSQLDL